MVILVVGGVGYIGFYMVKDLFVNGEEVVVVDNFLIGYCKVVDLWVKFYIGDICDWVFLD